MLGINQNLANPACRNLSFKSLGAEGIESSESSTSGKRNFNVIRDDGRIIQYDKMDPLEKVAFELGKELNERQNTPWAKKFEKII